MEYFYRSLAIWWMFMNTTLRAAVHLGKDYEANLGFFKDLSLENNRTAFQGNRKADQWSDRNHWHNPDQFPRFKVGINNLIAQSSKPICHCQGLCLLWLCALLGKIGKQSCWILEEANSMVFGQRLIQRIESNWWTTYGIRVQDFPSIHHSGNPQWDSTDDRKITVNQRTSQAGSSSCQCSATLYGMQKEMMKCVSIIQRQLKSMQKDFFAVICLPCGLDLKRSGTELTMANQMALGIELRRKCCRISKDRVVRYSDVPATWREDNWEAKEELLLQMIISVNQLSLCGAVADMIAELQVGRRAPGKPVASGQRVNKKFLHNLLSQTCKPMKSDKETYCKNMRNDLKNCQKTRSYPDHAPKQVWD